jgi:hypothetical protein
LGEATRLYNANKSLVNEVALAEAKIEVKKYEEYQPEVEEYLRSELGEPVSPVARQSGKPSSASIVGTPLQRIPSNIREGPRIPTKTGFANVENKRDGTFTSTLNPLATLRKKQGSARKRTLRTRRGVNKRNHVGGSRRRKNRSDRAHPHTRRRSKVHAR